MRLDGLSRIVSRSIANRRYGFVSCLPVAIVSMLLFSLTQGCGGQAAPALARPAVQNQLPPVRVIVGKMIDGQMKYDGQGLYLSINDIVPRQGTYPEKQYLSLRVAVMNGYDELLILERLYTISVGASSLEFDNGDGRGWGYGRGPGSGDLYSPIRDLAALYPSNVVGSGENAMLQVFHDGAMKSNEKFEILAGFVSIDSDLKLLKSGKYKFIDAGFSASLDVWFPRFDERMYFAIPFEVRFWMDDGMVKYKLQHVGANKFRPVGDHNFSLPESQPAN